MNHVRLKHNIYTELKGAPLFTNGTLAEKSKRCKRQQHGSAQNGNVAIKSEPMEANEKGTTGKPHEKGSCDVFVSPDGSEWQRMWVRLSSDRSVAFKCNSRIDQHHDSISQRAIENISLWSQALCFHM